MAEKPLTRRELGERYGVARNTIYLWVREGVIPEADVRFSNKSYWSESYLASWERAHLTLLTQHGVNVDQLPQFDGMDHDHDQKKTRRTTRSSSRPRPVSRIRRSQPFRYWRRPGAC